MRGCRLEDLGLFARRQVENRRRRENDFELFACPWRREASRRRSRDHRCGRRDASEERDRDTEGERGARRSRLTRRRFQMKISTCPIEARRRRLGLGPT